MLILIIGVEFLTIEEKVGESNWPNDFDDVKAYFKTLANTAANKKYKTKIIRSTTYNFIALNMFYYRDVLTIGIILLQKAVGVNRVYECNDGVYLQVVWLNDKTTLYGLEVLADRDSSWVVGPKFIDMERDRDGDIYHVMLDTRYLQDNRCQNIESINLVVVASSERVNYGQRGDDF